MARLVIPGNTPPPFSDSGQSMVEVCDRMGALASGNYWVSTRGVLKLGVFVSCPRFSKHERHVSTALKISRVADKCGAVSTQMMISFERERGSHGRSFFNPRSGVMIASRDRLCDFVECLVAKTVRIPGFDIESMGLYWHVYHPGRVYVHPYIDIDFKGDTTFAEIFIQVYRVIDIANKIFRASSDTAPIATAVYYNTRGNKHSFHIHWFLLVLDSTTQMAGLARVINSRVPAGSVQCDTRPYAPQHQLFRLPYCGKMGDDAAALQHIRPFQRPDSVWDFEIIPMCIQSINRSCVYTPFVGTFVPIQLETIERNIRRAQLPMAVVVPIATDTDRPRWLGFWTRVLRYAVIPEYIAHRQRLMSALNVRAASPDPSDFQVIERIDRLSNFIASYRVSVIGDNFCEHDRGHTPYTHQGSHNHISYVVDLFTCKIAQQCQKCRPAILKWHHFVQDGLLSFRMVAGEQARRECADSIDASRQVDPVPFFLRLHADEVLFCREKNQVLVYSSETGIWCAGSAGNRLLLKLIDNMNSAYMDYKRARNSANMDRMVAKWDQANQPPDPIKRAKMVEGQLKDLRKANRKVPPLWSLTMQQRKDVITALRTHSHQHEVERMELYPHLVPLKDAKCVDIYTLKIVDSTPAHYFTSFLNASIIDTRDQLVEDFTNWQRQVCCGDEEYVAYKLRLFGLSLTLLNFDRSFYMALGPIGRNGKSSESYLFNEVAMSVSPNRGYYLSREYLTKASQDRKGANSPDTVLTECADKTVVIADECRDTPLDCSLIKAFVSGEKTSARNLYESERVSVEPRFSLWIIANKTLKIDYGDRALMSRLKIMPYDAQWVPNPAQVRASLPLPQSLYVFQDDPYFKEKTLRLWGDAFVTSSLRALHLFLKTLPRDPDDPSRPLKLETFPIPTRVLNFTRTKIETEHPVLGFIKRYIFKIEGIETNGDVEGVFQSFRQMGRNENNYKIKYMTMSQFIEALQKEFIECTADEEGVNRMQGYTMRGTVPCKDRRVDVPFSYEQVRAGPPVDE